MKTQPVFMCVTILAWAWMIRSLAIQLLAVVAQHRRVSRTASGGRIMKYAASFAAASFAAASFIFVVLGHFRVQRKKQKSSRIYRRASEEQ
jgi:hypothetical protein